MTDVVGGAGQDAGDAEVDDAVAGHDEAAEDEAAQDGAQEAAAYEDGERAVKRARRVRRRRRFKIALLVVSATTSLGVATAFGLAAWDIQHLTHNLKHTALLPSGFTAPPEPVDAYGRSPLNLLLIGSDTRDTSADCSLGGACQPGAQNAGANGDSEMLVHLSADRSNITVMSIPRDTETQLPQCAGGGRGMINSALAHGPACQVAAVIQLTNIPVDHYIDFDFSGVIDLSDEIGGVPVCVSAAVHDPYSGLRIGGGDSTVEGKQALQFLRTREAFYDGSDLGREQATHMFLSSLLRKVKANATLTNIGEMQSIAETVTRYTTVDNGLDSVLSLLSLAQVFGEVDADRVTFLTMPWQEDTDTSDASYHARVEVSSEAAAVFADIKNDQSFTTTTSDNGSATPSGATASGATPSASGDVSSSPSLSPSPSLDAAAASAASASARASQEQAALKHPMHVDVINASGATQRYETVVPQVFRDGFVYSAGSDAAATQPTTTLVYAAKESAAAQELAGDLGLPASALQETGTGTTLTLTIGTDWTSGATYSAADSSFSASAAISVPTDSYEENGGDTSACVTANPDYETGSSGDSSTPSR
jgi:LCP family protein required for cell wall assembly